MEKQKTKSLTRMQDMRHEKMEREEKKRDRERK